MGGGTPLLLPPPASFSTQLRALPIGYESHRESRAAECGSMPHLLQQHPGKGFEDDQVTDS